MKNRYEIFTPEFFFASIDHCHFKLCANVILVSVSFVCVVGSKSLDASSLVLRAWFRGRLDVLAPSTATTTNF